MFYDQIKIPADRVGVLVGKKGETKRGIEKKTGIKMKINDDGLILIKSEDNLDLFITSSIIKAIGRGFNPGIAVSLWKDNMAFEITLAELSARLTSLSVGLKFLIS